MTGTPQPFADSKDKYARQYLIFIIVAFLLFLILFSRLWYLQVIKGEELRRRSDNNRTRVLDLAPVRGLIFDRSGAMLVDNQARFDLMVVQGEVESIDVLAAELSRLTGRLAQEFVEKYKALPKNRFNPQLLATGLSRAELVAVEAHRYRLSGISVHVTAVRQPLNDMFASHSIGYLGEINEHKLSQPQYVEYKAGDLIGQMGVEQGFETDLHGKRGYQRLEIDSRGRVLSEIEVKHPEPGHDIYLTLDSRLQMYAQELLGEKAGAIVVMDPRNFEVLAMASSPTFKLSDFTGGISVANWTALRDDPFSPMLNRPVAGTYAPGSTFKIVVALAALKENIITPEMVFYCHGSLRLGNHEFGCWNRGGHGAVNLHRSLKESCDVYYYEVGKRLGVDKLAEIAKAYFGIGQKPGLGLAGEAHGLMPDQAWKMAATKTPWRMGETLPVSIGQGAVAASPLQVAQYTGVIANGGTLYRSHLVREVKDANGETVSRFEPEILAQLDLPPDQILAVQKALAAVVNEPGGTGRRAILPNIMVAGKTGTSQVVRLKVYTVFNVRTRPYKYRDHAWFTSYAPANNPEVVVSVILEHSGGGGAFAAPVAQKMLEAYFDEKITAKALPPPQVQPDKPTGWRP